MTYCGVYSITSINTGRVYIGSTEDSDQRWAKHQTLLKCNTHWNIDLQSAYNNEGTNGFIFRVVEECPPHQLIERETHHIEALGWPSRARVYNFRLPQSTLSQEAKDRISKSRVGMTFTDTHRRNIGLAMSKLQKGKKRGPRKKREVITTRDTQ